MSTNCQVPDFEVGSASPQTARLPPTVYNMQFSQQKARVFDWFFSLQNQEFLRAQLEEELERRFGFPVSSCWTEDRRLAMMQVANVNQGVPDTPAGLTILNTAFLQQELPVSAASVLRKLLYWRFFTPRRPFLPCPYRATQSARAPGGSVGLGTSGYTLSNPVAARLHRQMVELERLSP